MKNSHFRKNQKKIHKVCESAQIVLQLFVHIVNDIKYKKLFSINNRINLFIFFICYQNIFDVAQNVY